MEEGWNNVKRVCSISVLILVLVGVVGAGETSCHAIRYTFLKKNLDITDVPKTTQQGEKKFVFSSIFERFFPINGLGFELSYCVQSKYTHMK